jgi:circadian clock protein KaiC
VGAAIVRAARAGLVVVEGFRGRRPADGPHAVRRFLYDLGTALSLQGATTVITSEGHALDPAFFGESTTADVIVGVETARDNVRTTRWIEVIKARGTSPMTGMHGLTIRPDGGAVHPRLEARVAPRAEDGASTTPPTEPAATPPISFGHPGLDAVLAGGVSRDTTTLVIGGSSTGKTLLGLHFALAGVAAGEPTVYLSLRESRRQLLRKCDPFDLGQSLRAALSPGGGLTLLWRPAVELDIERLADDLVTAIDGIGARRFVLDSVVEWERAVGEGSDPRRIPNHLTALVEVLHARAVTALVIREGRGATTQEGKIEEDALASLVENVIALEEVVHKGRAHRVLSVPKLRFAPRDPDWHEVVIAPPDGLRVLGAFRADAGVLEALAEEEAGERDRGTEQTPADSDESESGRGDS